MHIFPYYGLIRQGDLKPKKNQKNRSEFSRAKYDVTNVFSKQTAQPLESTQLKRSMSQNVLYELWNKIF
jgi:hypothetical protein